MNVNKIQIDEAAIDIKEVFRIIYRYRYMIVSLLILSAAASSYYAYFKHDIYKASATVEVGLGGNDGGHDVLSAAMDPGTKNADTEMEIIKSRFLAKKALEKVNFTHLYYSTRKFKEIELYKDTPFEVGMLKGYGVSFDFYPIDETHYRLVVNEARGNNANVWSYDKIHSYGKEIVSEYFHLNIVKIKEPQEPRYRFVVLEKGSLHGAVNVSQRSRYSTILEISYEDNVALRAQEFANALSEAYIHQNIEKKTKEATRKLTFINKQLKLITENLKGSAIKLEEFKKTSNTINLSSKAENIIRQMSDKETKLTEISMQEEMLDILYKQVKVGKSLESMTIVGLDDMGHELSLMIKELQDAILQKNILREDYTEMYPAVSKLRKKITQFKKRIITTIKNLRKSIKDRKELLEKSIAKQQKHLNTLPADERMFGQLQRKFAVNEKIYSYLLEKRSETAIIKASTVSKNRIIDEALTPSGPIKPKRKTIILIGLALGLALGIILAYLRNYLDDRIKDEDDIANINEYSLLGVIPEMKSADETIAVFASPKSGLAEAFRNLRTNLQFMVKAKTAHTIAVTSTIGAEGKTTICINLGGIMSMAEKKTIILNLDMRKPTLHARFDLENKQGMSTLLSGHASLDEVIQKSKHDHLHIISSGPVPPNPSELIQSDIMIETLDKLKEMYDVIILDTPPVGLVTDARTLMHYADTNIYVLRANYSKKEFLKNIKKLSTYEDIKGLSILLNAVKMDKNSYGYGYGYGYGYYEENEK